MRLADFILSELEAILVAWVEFARTRISAGRGMTDLALSDDAADILQGVAHDMRTSQSSSEQEVKSRGGGAADGLAPGDAAARRHGLQRSRSGFEVNQMVSEFRALRATVLRLWGASGHEPDVRDLEDVMRFNEAIDEALAESLKRFAGEVDRARALFLGVLGHDLRTPLGTIVTCASILHLRRPDDAREAALIQRSAQRMRELVDVVLSYTRTSLGAALPLHLGPTRLDDVVRHCIRELALANPARDIALDISGDLGGLWDSSRLAQVASNLIGNALKYGAPEQRIDVVLDGKEAHEVAFKVHNFGVPIPPELLGDIFEPLVRGPSQAGAARAGGADMGLGLYIAREVVAAHLGSLGVCSDAAAGTTFEVRLPRASRVDIAAGDRAADGAT